MSFLRVPSLGKRKRRQYDTSLIASAFHDVQTKGLSVYKAARLYGIPESTLRDRHLGIQSVDFDNPVSIPMPGPNPTFTRDEEQGLVEHVTYMSSIGYGYSKQSFLNLATDFAVNLGKKTIAHPSFKQSWYTKFVRRWPGIHLCKPQKLAMIRAKVTSKEVLDKYYGALEEVLNDNDLTNKPERIWNIDETGNTMEHTPPKVVCDKGSTPQSVTSSRGKNVTIIGRGNAAGNHIPPYFIFPGKRWSDEFLQEAGPGSSGEMSESGWSNSVTFMNYLKNHFRRFVPKEAGRKDLILLDGHKSHVSLSLTDWGKDNGVIFFVLPPHTSHVTQPLDVGCFAPLKAIYNSECQSFMRSNPGCHITKHNIGKLAGKAYLKAMTPDNLISSFRKTGIYPLDKNTVGEKKVMPATIYPDKADKTDPDDACTRGIDEVQSSQNTDRVADKSTQSSQIQNTDAVTDDPITNFLDSRKITKISDGKKKSKLSIIGNLYSSQNQDALKSSKVSSSKSKEEKSLSLKGKQKLVISDHDKAPASKKSKKQAVQTSKSQQPGVSGVSAIRLSEDTEYDSDSMDDMNEDELCCVCKKFSPPPMNLAFMLEISTWAQCDECDHWTHLKHCTKIRCARRDDSFLCPHCDKSTAVVHAHSSK